MMHSTHLDGLSSRLEPGRDWCPVSYCGNYGGGFKRLADHIESQHMEELATEVKEKDAIIRSLEKINKFLCPKCLRIRAMADETGTCLQCLKQDCSSGEG